MRSFEDIRDRPQPGDFIELKENGVEVMLRVIAFAEDHVWYKEYGKGRPVSHISTWNKRLSQATSVYIVHTF